MIGKIKNNEKLYCVRVLNVKRLKVAHSTKKSRNFKYFPRMYLTNNVNFFQLSPNELLPIFFVQVLDERNCVHKCTCCSRLCFNVTKSPVSMQHCTSFGVKVKSTTRSTRKQWSITEYFTSISVGNNFREHSYVYSTRFIKFFVNNLFTQWIVFTLKKHSATLLLVPLLGLQYILTPFKPEPGHSWERAYETISAFTASFQVSVGNVLNLCN